MQTDSRRQKAWVPSGLNVTLQTKTTMQTTQGQGFPSLQPTRMSALNDSDYLKAQSQPGRPRQQPRVQASYTAPRSDFSIILNSKPIELVLAEQKAADDRMVKYQRGAR